MEGERELGLLLKNTLHAIGPLVRRHGAQGALVETLYGNGQLKLEYESTVTRNAAEAFEARSGNCLSLVIMTAAFARELGLSVRCQSAYLEETWSRRGSLLLKSGHVNITLGQRVGDHTASSLQYSQTIDFLPPEQLRTLKTVEIRESLIVAMFMNNRSVEALVQGRLDDAYALAREAARADPWFLAARALLRAAEASASRGERDLYSAKLDWLRAHHAR